MCAEIRRDKILLEEGGKFRALAKVGDTIEIQDETETTVMALESHASRHADGGDDPLPDYSISESMLQTGSVTVNKFAVHLGELGPIPDVVTEYSFPYTLPSAPKQAIVTPTTGGVMGYVQVDSLMTTGISLVANVSGVKALVTVLL